MSKRKAKYALIVDSLKEKIKNGHYPIGSRLPGQHSLAREYGVSAITSNRALNELKRLGMIERRERGGSFVSSQGNLIKKLVLVTERFPEEHTPLLSYWHGVTAKCEELGIRNELVLKSSPDFEKMLFSDKEHGVILLMTETEALTEGLRVRNIPHVLLGLESKYSKLCVTENRRGAAYALTRILANESCERIAFLGTFQAPCHRQARDGHLEALSELNYEYRETRDVDSKNIKHVLSELLSEPTPPDALVIFGGYLPFLALPTILNSEINLKLGFFEENDNVPQLNDLAYIAKYSHFESGRLALDLLLLSLERKLSATTIQYSPFSVETPSGKSDRNI